MGRYIAAKRKELGMTQKDLAQRLHLTRQAVSKWESGKSVPDPETLLVMAQLFRVTVEEILSGEARPEEAQEIHQVCSIPLPVPETRSAPVYGFQEPSPVPPTRPAIRHWAGWLLWVPAILAAVLVCLIPLVKIVGYSFTSFNILESPRFVGLQNYADILGDPLTQQAAVNTLFILLAAGGAAVLLGWLLGRSAARLPLPVGVIIGILLGSGSLSALFPVWASLLFSTDALGLLNSWLLSSGWIQDPIPWTALHSNGIQLLLLFLLCLAPAYFIFFIAGRSGRRRAAWHIAVTAVPAILLAGWMLPLYTVGFPSADYRAHWLPAMIYDYGGIRFQVGTACALLVLCLVLTAVPAAAANLLVWGIGKCLPTAEKSGPGRHPRQWHWWDGAAGAVIGLALQFPLVITLSYALKPLDELLAFPATLLPRAPTTEAFAMLDSLWSGLGLERLPLYALLSLAAFILLAVPVAAGMAFLQNRGKPVAAALWFGYFALGPCIFLSYTWRISISNSLLLSSLAAYTSSPLLPLSVLLTVWILRKSTAGCPNFSVWLRQPKRLIGTAAALLVTGICTSLSMIYALMPMVYDEFIKPPIQYLYSMQLDNMSHANFCCAVSLTVMVPGILMLLLLTAALLVMNRVSRIPVSGRIPAEGPEADPVPVWK